MTPEDQSRSEFEAWAKPKYFPYVKTQFLRNGTYAKKLVQAAWLAWQASRRTYRVSVLEEACRVVYGMAGSDNVAERTVNAIRALAVQTQEGKP